MRRPHTETRLPNHPAIRAACGMALAILVCSGAALAGPGEAAIVAASHATPGQAEASVEGVEGRVLQAPAGDELQPAVSALVYAFDVASQKLRKVETDEGGRFLFEHLPAGMYKLVAFQPGFVPTVELLLRRTPRDPQFVEIRLREEDPSDVRQAESYWDVRDRVPVDVLREIQQIELLSPGLAAAGDSPYQLQNAEFFEAEMRALSGVESHGARHTQWSQAEVGLEGRVGNVEVGLDGTFQHMTPSTSEASAASDVALRSGEVRNVAFHLAGGDDRRLRLASTRGEIEGDVDLRRYQVDWQGKAGEAGETEVRASFTEETGYHRGGPIEPAVVPGASSTWDLSGLYRGELGSKTRLEAGLTYRQRSFLGGSGAFDDPSDESVGLFGVAGSRIVPRVLVEYGLYSSVRDGSLSLMPHGGVVVELGDGWKARTSFAQRVEDEDPQEHYRGFGTASYDDRSSCREAGESCYEVLFTRNRDDDEELTLGAIHREYAETLRLYFSPDFFERLESLFVVEGDRLPELQFSMIRRVSPQILARLESNFASGGGGIFYATDATAYENQVRYLVTSLDTQFQQTSTGVFVAFHHLEQSLQPAETLASDAPNVEMQRLQLMLTQDLSALADLASNWAVRLNMELSRGTADTYRLTADDETRKKLSGGFSVSF